MKKFDMRELATWALVLALAPVPGVLVYFLAPWLAG